MVSRGAAEGPQASAPQPNLEREGRPSARADAGGPVRGKGMINQHYYLWDCIRNTELGTKIIKYTVVHYIQTQVL
eukprot:6190241-Pleurochrysis_carterae.AAC.3